MSVRDEFAGEWQANTNYYTRQSVMYQGGLYRAAQDHVSGSSFDSSLWVALSLSAGSSSAAGRAFQANTAYKAGDVIVQAGGLYTANADFTSGASFNAPDWTAVSAAGDGKLLSVTGAPTSGQGNNGDYAVDTTNGRLYGPKAAGAWPSTFTLAGQTTPNSEFPVRWMGAWTTGVTYLRGDVVLSSGMLWMRVNDAGGASSGSFAAAAPNQSSYYQRIGAGQAFRNTWVTATFYEAGDYVVEPGGTLVQARVEHTSSAAYSTDAASKWRTVTWNPGAAIKPDVLLAAPYAQGQAALDSLGIYPRRGRVKLTAPAAADTYHFAASTDFTSATSSTGYSAEADPMHPSGSLRWTSTGASTITLRKDITATDISAKIARVMCKLSDDRANLTQFKIQVSSGGSAAFTAGNYLECKINDTNEGLIAFADTWDSIGVGPSNWATVGTGANLAAINSFQIVFQTSASGSFFTIGQVAFLPVVSTKAKFVIWLDDGFAAHWTNAAAKMIPYGFPGMLAWNIGDQTTTLAYARQLVRKHGWGVGSHAFSSAQHINSAGDLLRSNLLKSKHLLGAYGLGSGEDMAWWGGLQVNDDSLRAVEQYHRSGRFNLSGCRISESLPPINPLRTLSWLENDAEVFDPSGDGSTGMKRYVNKVIAEKGLGQIVYHGAQPVGNFDPLLAYLDANRASIDVVTIADALAPYTVGN